ncbi:MAG TPA: ABC transporter permease [Ktedonosporobacter sp.]|nr:ABC transporter permease [Ktedonosporobacter sp.]
MRITTFPDKTAQQEQTIKHSLPAGRNTRRLHRRQALLITGGRILLFVCLIGVWQLASGAVNPLFISSPLAVAKQLVAWISDGTLWFHTEITLQETLLGLVFGIVTGIVFGFLFGLQQVLAKILDPFIISLNSIPKVALAPLFMVWFGIDIQMKVVLAAVTVFFLVFLNTLAGVRNVDQDLIDAVLLMGGKRWDIVFKVIVPSATGAMLTGLRVAIPYALIGAVIAELIVSNRGLGYLIMASESEFNTAGIFAALLVLTAIAAILNAIVNIVDKKTSRWKASVSIDRKVIP